MCLDVGNSLLKLRSTSLVQLSFPLAIMRISRQLKIMKAVKAKNAKKAMKKNESDSIDQLTEIAMQCGFIPNWVPNLPNEIKIMVLIVQIAKSDAYAEYRRMTSHA